MYAAFTDKPVNLAPYSVTTPTYPIDEKNAATAPNARLSKSLRLNRTDKVPQRVLDRILWQSVHGAKSMPPPPGPNAVPYAKDPTAARARGRMRGRRGLGKRGLHGAVSARSWRAGDRAAGPQIAGRGHLIRQDLVADGDEISDPELTSPPRLRLAVDRHRAVGEQRLGLAAVLGDAGELEQLAEADHVAADRDVDRLAHTAPCTKYQTKTAENRSIEDVGPPALEQREHGIGHEAGAHAVGDRVGHRHEHDGQQDGQRDAPLGPRDVPDELEHRRPDDDEDRGGRLGRDDPGQRGEEQAEQEQHAGDDGGQARAPALLDPGGALDERRVRGGRGGAAGRRGQAVDEQHAPHPGQPPVGRGQLRAPAQPEHGARRVEEVREQHGEHDGDRAARAEHGPEVEREVAHEGEVRGRRRSCPATRPRRRRSTPSRRWPR